jgi:hypothetical protein
MPSFVPTARRQSLHVSRSSMLYLKAVAGWFALLVAVVATGALRQLFLEPRLGEHRAHQIGTVLACLVAFAVIYALVGWMRPTLSQALALGALWVVLALGFEFGFFHFARGVPWETLLRDYDIRGGRLLVLLWLTTLLGPPAAVLLRR